MIGADEMTALRAVAESAMPDTCKVERQTKTSDGMGGYTESWSTTATVKCRIAENKHQNREHEIGGKVQSSGSHIVRVPYATSVNESDRLVVTTGGRTRTMNINRVYESSYGTVLSIGCTETRGD